MRFAFSGRLAAAALGLVIAAQCGAARADATLLTANSGIPFRFAFVSEVGPDCKVVGTPDVRVANTAFHGTIQLRSEQGFPSYGDDNPRHVCNGRRVKGVAVYYTSDKGYVGEDFFTLSYAFDDGTEASGDFAVTIK